MIIEQLTFAVPPSDQPAFLLHDAAIWTQVLAAQPGYLGKEIWREAAAPGQLHLIIRWTDRAAWKAVPKDLLAQTDAAFVTALGQAYPILRCLDQEVLSPPAARPGSGFRGGYLDLDQKLRPREARDDHQS